MLKLLSVARPRFAANGVLRIRKKSCPLENGPAFFATLEFVFPSEERISVDLQLSPFSVASAPFGVHGRAASVGLALMPDDTHNAGASRCSGAMGRTRFVDHLDFGKRTLRVYPARFAQRGVMSDDPVAD